MQQHRKILDIETGHRPLCRYNDRSEVTSASSANDTTYNFSFNFDAIGNRTSTVSNETGSTVTTSYTTNELNQYTNITNPSQSPTYDDDGNCTSAVLSSPSGGSSVPFSFTFNAENRITVTESASGRLEFTYDYMGRRIRKKVFTGSAGNWTLSADYAFVYDNFQQIEKIDLLNNNAVVNKRIWSAGNRSGANRILCDIHSASGTE